MSTTTLSGTRLFVPTPLRGFTGGASAVVVEGDTVSAALKDLVEKYPALKQHLVDERSELRSFINIYRNDDDIRYLDGHETLIHPGDTLSIIPSIAGGRSYIQ